MKVRLLEEIDGLPYDLDWSIYPSIRAAAKDLGCDARHLSAQLKGKRKETTTNAGKVTQIKVYNEPPVETHQGVDRVEEGVSKVQWLWHKILRAFARE